MYKFLSYPLSVIFYFFFGSLLITFHCIQWLSFYFFGYTAHKKSVDLLNFFIIKSLSILRTKIIFENKNQLPKNNSIIFVANHQSTYDIPPLIWYLRDYHAKFISKKELGRGIPSISFNLRHGGSLLIDRSKAKDALVAIEDYANTLNRTKHSVVIFPEGTRSGSATPRRFRLGGLVTLFENMPEAVVLPVSISHSWKLMKWGDFPMMPGVTMRFTVHEPIPVKGQKANELAARVEQIIVGGIED